MKKLLFLVSGFFIFVTFNVYSLQSFEEIQEDGQRIDREQRDNNNEDRESGKTASLDRNRRGNYKPTVAIGLQMGFVLPLVSTEINGSNEQVDLIKSQGRITIGGSISFGDYTKNVTILYLGGDILLNAPSDYFALDVHLDNIFINKQLGSGKTYFFFGLGVGFGSYFNPKDPTSEPSGPSFKPIVTTNHQVESNYLFQLRTPMGVKWIVSDFAEFFIQANLSPAIKLTFLSDVSNPDAVMFDLTMDFELGMKFWF